MPRPSWLLIVTSTLFILALLYFGGLTLAGFFHWDPRAWVVAIIIGGPSLFLACCQYVVAFCRHELLANLLRHLLLLMSAGAVLLSVVIVAEPIASGAVPTREYVTALVLPTLLAGLVLGWIGFLDFRWYRQLAAAPVMATLVEEDDSARPRPCGWRISLWHSSALVAALAVVLAGATKGYRDTPPRLALHVSPEEARLDLPAGAADVCVWRGSRGTATIYDFAIDEPGFREWAKSIEVSPDCLASSATVQPVAGSFEIETINPAARAKLHTVNRGWYFECTDDRSTCRYVYDADQGRAYFAKF